MKKYEIFTLAAFVGVLGAFVVIGAGAGTIFDTDSEMIMLDAPATTGNNPFAPKFNTDRNDIPNTSDSLAMYEDRENGYTIGYPSTWIVDNDADFEKYLVSFYDKVSPDGVIHVMYFDDIDFTGYTDQGILDYVVEQEKQYCMDVTDTIEGEICYGFEMIDTSIIPIAGKMGYVLDFGSARQYSDAEGEYPLVTRVIQIPDGTGSWLLIGETNEDVFDVYSDILLSALESFLITAP